MYPEKWDIKNGNTSADVFVVEAWNLLSKRWSWAVWAVHKPSLSFLHEGITIYAPPWGSQDALPSAARVSSDPPKGVHVVLRPCASNGALGFALALTVPELEWVPGTYFLWEGRKNCFL